MRYLLCFSLVYLLSCSSEGPKKLVARDETPTPETQPSTTPKSQESNATPFAYPDISGALSIEEIPLPADAEIIVRVRLNELITQETYQNFFQMLGIEPYFKELPPDATVLFVLFGKNLLVLLQSDVVAQLKGGIQAKAPFIAEILDLHHIALGNPETLVTFKKAILDKQKLKAPTPWKQIDAKAALVVLLKNETDDAAFSLAFSGEALTMQLASTTKNAEDLLQQATDGVAWLQKKLSSGEISEAFTIKKEEVNTLLQATAELLAAPKRTPKESGLLLEFTKEKGGATFARDLIASYASLMIANVYPVQALSISSYLSSLVNLGSYVQLPKKGDLLKSSDWLGRNGLTPDNETLDPWGGSYWCSVVESPAGLLFRVCSYGPDQKADTKDDICSQILPNPPK
jgi:hypothetical protein